MKENSPISIGILGPELEGRLSFRCFGDDKDRRLKISNLAPIILYVFSASSTTVAVIFMIWSIAVSMSDAFLKPLLLGRGVEVPMLIILVGAIGGMIYSGIIGLFVGAVILALGYVSGFVPWRIFIMAAAPVIQYVVYKRALRRGISAKDCIALTWIGAALFIIYHLWVLFDLPGAGL